MDDVVGHPGSQYPFVMAQGVLLLDPGVGVWLLVWEYGMAYS